MLPQWISSAHRNTAYTTQSKNHSKYEKYIIIMHADMNILYTWKVWIIPVIICGSAAWHLTVATALVCPDNVCTLALVLTSQIYKTSTQYHQWKQVLLSSGR